MDDLTIIKNAAVRLPKVYYFLLGSGFGLIVYIMWDILKNKNK
jgi:hypothetical protein